MQTAEPLAGARNLPVTITADLTEVDWGEWTGVNLKTLEALPEWTQFNAQRAFLAPPGGETPTELRARVFRFLNKAINGTNDRVLVAFTHSDVIKTALLGCLGVSLQMMHQLDIQPVSISTIESFGQVPRIVGMNCV